MQRIDGPSRNVPLVRLEENRLNAGTSGAAPATLDLRHARRDYCPLSPDIKLRGDTIYKAPGIEDVLRRLNTQPEVPLWLLLYKNGSPQQNMPDKIVYLHQNPARELAAHFTDYQRNADIVLGKRGFFFNPDIDKMAKTLRENVGYARLLGGQSQHYSSCLKGADDINGLAHNGSRIEICITQPKAPGVGLPGPTADSMLSSGERLRTGVARWPDKQYDQSQSVGNQSYGLSLYHSARDAGKHLSEGHIKGFQELWRYASEWRLAQHLHQHKQPSAVTKEAAMNMATARNNKYDLELAARNQLPPHHTPINDRYSFFHQRAMMKKMNIEDTYTPYPFAPFSSFSMKDSDSTNGEDIRLTSHFMSPLRTRKEVEQAVRENKYMLGFIEHTPITNIKPIMNHVEKLFGEALAVNEVSPSERLTKLAEIHWWVAHAMPDSRGSAAKVEFCVRAMANAAGMDLPPFRDGILPDLEAMAMDRQAYVMRYPDLFERHPIHSRTTNPG